MKAICNNIIIINNLKIANSFLTKLIGLLPKKEILDEGLLLKNCSSIHCFFMRFTIDVIYLSKDMEILYKETIMPWRIGKIVKGTKHVLELPEGTAANIKIGQIIKLEM